MSLINVATSRTEGDPAIGPHSLDEFDYRSFFDGKFQVEDNGDIRVRDDWSFSAFIRDRVSGIPKTPSPGHV